MYNKYLKTFIEVAEYGSFTKAAEHLYISSVGVQKQISSLEKELDLKLFERTKQGVELTYAGQRVYKDSKKLIEFCDNEMEAIKEKENNCLKVANFIIKNTDTINENMLKKYKKKFIILPFVSKEKNGFDDMEEDVKQGFDAFIFTKFVDSSMKDWNYKYLFDSPLKLIVPKGNDLFMKRKISYSDLENTKICFFARGLLEDYDKIREKINQTVPSLKAIDFEPGKITLNETLNIMGNYPFVTIDGIDFVVSNSKSIPFSFNTDISIGLYTKTNFFD